MGHVNSVLMALSKCPNPTVFQKTLSVNDFYFSSPDWEFPMVTSHSSQARWGHSQSRCAKGRTEMDAGFDGQAFARFLAHIRDLPNPNNRVTIIATRDRLTNKPNNEEGHKR